MPQAFDFIMFEYLERYHKVSTKSYLSKIIFLNIIQPWAPKKKHQNPSQVPHRPQPANKWRAPVAWESHVPSTLNDSLLHCTLLLQHPKPKWFCCFSISRNVLFVGGHLSESSTGLRVPVMKSLHWKMAHLTCVVYIKPFYQRCIYQPTWPTFWDQQAICCFPTLHAARRRSPRLPRA